MRLGLTLHVLGTHGLCRVGKAEPRTGDLNVLPRGISDCFSRLYGLSESCRGIALLKLTKNLD